MGVPDRDIADDLVIDRVYVTSERVLSLPHSAYQDHNMLLYITEPNDLYNLRSKLLLPTI